MDDRSRYSLEIMETQTSFDLNLAIRRWRENLANSPAFQSENLNELESHLRDSTDRMRTPQLSEEEAFLIAARRIGQSRQLESEFGKLNRNSIWLGRVIWMLIGIQVWPLFDLLTSNIVGYAFALGWTNVHHGRSAIGDAWPVFFSALIQLPAFITAIWLTWSVVRKSGRLGEWLAARMQNRSSFVISCFATSILVFLLYGILYVLPSELWKFLRNPIPSEIYLYIATSRSCIGILRVIGFAVLTLLLARKQLVEKRA